MMRGPAHTVPRLLVRLARPALWALLLAGVSLCGMAQARTILTVAAFPAEDEIVKAAIPEWNRRHPDVEIRLISRQIADHHTAMTTALSTRSHLPDVMALEIHYVGGFTRTGALDDLRQPPYNFTQDSKRFVPYAVAQVTGPHGELTAVPTDIGPGTLLYRTDILAKAGVTEADLTRSWESYVEAGIKIKAATGAFLIPNAHDIKDIVIRTGIKPGEGMYFDGDGHALVNTPRFAHAFELARAVRRNGLDARVLAWSSDWAEGFKRGSLATQMSGAWAAGHLATWLAPNTAGLWRAAQLPEGTYAAWGGTYLAIPKASDPANKAAAYEFIRMLTLEPAMQLAAFKEQNAFPALTETYTDPFFAQPIPFLAGQRARELWRDAAVHIGAVRVHKQDAFAEEVVNSELDKVLEKNKDIGQALADAERLLQRRALR
ncbi:MAG TPA: extracellular solute-binding protein [Burkholderiaceae bacterium]